MSKEGLLPIIRQGMWVRLKPNATSLPAWAKGQNAVVLRAAIKHHQSGVEGDVNPMNYEYQSEDLDIRVRVRENGGELEVKRAQIEAFATNVGDLAGATVGRNGQIDPESYAPALLDGEKVYEGDGVWLDPKTGERYDEVDGGFVPVTPEGVEDPA